MTTIAVVINPIAGGGQGMRVWQELKPGLNALFDKIIYKVSNRVNDLDAITRGFLSENPDFLLVIGGDGTLSHVLNGLMAGDKLSNLKTKLAYFNTGTGGDFARQFPPQKITEFLDRLSHSQSVESNIGKMTFPLSSKAPRYFINIASCGLSGHVVEAMARSQWLKKLGGTLNYFIHSFTGLIAYQRTKVRITLDESSPFECSMLMLAVCNGQYFGGRMHVAPMAKIDDDVLDVVLFRDFTKLDALFKLRKIYTGGHLLDKNVHYVQAKKVVIEPLEKRKVKIEADGEAIGSLPVTFELIEQRISIII